MNKKIKILILLFLLGIACGSIVTVYRNYKKEKFKNGEDTEIISKDKYKVIRKSNKYTLISNSSSFKERELSDIFYDDKNVFLYLDGGDVATLLKYNIEENKVKVLYEDSEQISGGIVNFGNYYIIKDTVYNSSFKKVSKFVDTSDNELLFPNLKYKLVKTDTGIIKRRIVDDKEEEYIRNIDGITYDLYLISNDGETVLLKRKSDEKIDLVYLDNEGEVNKVDIDFDTENDYRLLTDKYLLEQKKENEIIKSSIYDITTGNSILTSDNNSIYSGVNLVYKDDENSVILQNYVTQEEREIFNSRKEVNKFICSSDSFSLLLQFMNDKKSFYIIYL